MKDRKTLRGDTGSTAPGAAQGARCGDCFHCQGCAPSRCRVCRHKAVPHAPPGLPTGFTYGDYLAWKSKRIHDKEADH